jgi:hypothetical protein
MKNLKLKRIILIALILGSLGNTIQGQIDSGKKNKSVYITGVAFDSKTKEPLSNANFRINHKSSFVTNESGRFSFFGFPNDTVVFTYMGYQPTRLIVPDTLKSDEYVMGVFMREQAVKLAEIIILRRINSSSIIITPVQNDQRTMNIAQSNVDKAAMEGLTKAPKVYDADMNARKTMRTNQIRSEYKGMLATPENTVGLSTQSYKNYNVIYGSPVINRGKVAREMITNNESWLLLKHFEDLRKMNSQREEITDTISNPE